MASIFVLNRQTREDEADLGAPDESEADDLKHHVGRCALRFRFLARGQGAQATRLQRIEVILFGIAIWLFATSPMAHDMIKKVMGF